MTEVAPDCAVDLSAYALEYARRGWPVFPLKPNCKQPLTARGFHDASTDPAQVRAWWEQWPDANIGVVAGAASGLVVLDVDRKNGTDGAVSAAELDLPPTLVVRTPSGGYHLFYAQPAGAPVPRRIGVRPGLDILGEGGYFVAAGSIVNGAAYEIVRDRPIAECPPALVALAGEAKARGGRAGAAAKPGAKVGAGGRNDFLASRGGAMRAIGMTPAEILAALLQTNRECCDPELPEAEVRGVAASVSRYEPAEAPTFAGIATFAFANLQAAKNASAWPDPQPLTPEGTPEAYPVDCLPDAMAAAVREVQRFNRAPMALVAGSALSALSVAGQALADVQRADGLTGPCSLYLLTVADSGERKTSTDGLFVTPIREWEQEQAEQAKPFLLDYHGRLKAWKAQNEGLEASARKLASTGKSTQEALAAIRDHEADKPQAPRFPRVLHGDSTTEALAYALAHEWPSAGVIASEAGVVFGSHAMGQDSVMRNLATLNVLWDGGTLRIARRTTESYVVRGARATLALQVQAPTLRAFVERSQGLVRGSGFLARFLVATPTSTQGFRPFVEPPAGWPSLTAYQQRLQQLLATHIPVDESWCLVPPALSLSGPAKRLWVAFHDAVETELRPGGELDDAKDVASKAADNAARLACLFHVLDHGPDGSIGAESVERGAELVRWYLGEARRLLSSLAVNPEAVAAQDLLAWLVRECRQAGTNHIPAGNVLRLGPYACRSKAGRDAALSLLADAGWVAMVQEGKQKHVCVNPKGLQP